MLTKSYSCLYLFGLLLLLIAQTSAQTTGAIVYVLPTENNMQGVFVDFPGERTYQIPVSFDSISELQISPNGEWVGVIGQTLKDVSNDAWNIYVFSPTGAQFTSITSFTSSQAQGYTALPEALAFSNDGSKIAFTVVTLGGQAQSVSLISCELPTCVQSVGVGSVSLSGYDGVGVAWSPDGQSLVVPVTCSSDCPTSDSTIIPVTSLWIVPDITNGQDSAKELTSPLPSSFNEAKEQVLPVFSPDGTSLAFVVWSVNLASGAQGFSAVSTSSIYVVSAQGGAPTLVYSVQGALINSLSWIQDPNGSGTLLFSEAQPSTLSAMGVWMINTDGSGLKELLSGSALGVWSSTISLSNLENVTTQSMNYPSAPNASSVVRQSGTTAQAFQTIVTNSNSFTRFVFLVIIFLIVVIGLLFFRKRAIPPPPTKLL
jgi:hypothetical protein